VLAFLGLVLQGQGACSKNGRAHLLRSFPGTITNDPIVLLDAPPWVDRETVSNNKGHDALWFDHN